MSSKIGPFVMKVLKNLGDFSTIDKKVLIEILRTSVTLDVINDQLNNESLFYKETPKKRGKK